MRYEATEGALRGHTPARKCLLRKDRPRSQQRQQRQQVVCCRALALRLTPSAAPPAGRTPNRARTAKGRLIAPTLPVVKRNKAGYAVSVRGKVLTEHGAPTRRATHPRAVQTGDREPNPEAVRAYPWLTDRDLLLLCHKEVGATDRQLIDQRRRTIETLKALRDDGLLYFETRYRAVRGGRELEAVRLLPSAAHAEVHAARWAARKHNRAGA